MHHNINATTFWCIVKRCFSILHVYKKKMEPAYTIDENDNIYKHTNLTLYLKKKTLSLTLRQAPYWINVSRTPDNLLSQTWWIGAFLFWKVVSKHDVILVAIIVCYELLRIEWFMCFYAFNNKKTLSLASTSILFSNSILIASIWFLSAA